MMQDRGTPATAGSNESGRAGIPRIAVLLATHNCELWLAEQLSSIYQQRDVQVSMIASDDASTDATASILRRFAQEHDLNALPPKPARFGNANCNFLRLIGDARVGSAAYIALSDHDDIWFDTKLSTAVNKIEQLGLDAYSSDVIAIWPDGKRKTIVKSQPQRRFDHLFESAGPGCTFVLRRSRFDELQAWVRAEAASLDKLKVHDWTIYAYARTRGWRWLIDDRPGLLYRQHARNEMGANIGVNGALRRLREVLEGRYRQDALRIARAVGEHGAVIQRLERLSLRDRLLLALTARECRRRRRDALALGLMFLTMPRAKQADC